MNNIHIFYINKKHITNKMKVKFDNFFLTKNKYSE